MQGNVEALAMPLFEVTSMYLLESTDENHDYFYVVHPPPLFGVLGLLPSEPQLGDGGGAQHNTTERES
jgi:hypothetical protein